MQFSCDLSEFAFHHQSIKIESLCLCFLFHQQELIDSCDPICSVDEPGSSYFEANYQPKTDVVKAIAVLAAALTGTAAINHSWVAANQVLLAHDLFLLVSNSKRLISGQCHDTGYCYGIVVWSRIRRDHLRRVFSF